MTIDAKKLLAECERRGLQLEPRGDKLFVAPEENVTPELVVQLQQRKFEIIGHLEAKQRAAWNHVAKQIILGEFDGCAYAMRQSFVAGLCSLQNPLARCAIEKLKEMNQR